MSSPFAAPALLAAGLVFLFGGERLFGEDVALRMLLDTVGLAGVAGSLATRGRANAPAEIKRWFLAIHGGIVAALVLYALQLPFATSAIGLGAESEKTLRAVLGTLWPIVLAVSSLTAFFLDAALVGARRMPSPETLRIRASAQAGAVLGLLVAIFGVSNYVVQAHSPEIDLSRRKVGRPTDATIAVARNVDQTVYANVFFPQANEVMEEIDPYLRSLEKLSEGKVKVLRFDHALDVRAAKRVNAKDNGAIYFTRASVEEGLGEADPPALAAEKLQVGLKLEGSKSVLKKFDAEVQKRILKALRGNSRVYFTAGHGERNAKGNSHVEKNDGRGKLSLLNRLLAERAYEVKTLTAADGLTSAVPADAGAVVIAGPTEAWLDAEIEALEGYFDRGGSIFILLESGRPDGVPVKLLEHLGIAYDPVYAANESSYIPETRTPKDRLVLVTNKTTSHPSVTTITKNKSQLALIVPRTGSVSKADGTKVNVQLVVQSYAGAFRDKNGNFEKDADESVAPEKLALIATAEGEKKDGKSGKAVVSASVELFEDKWFRNHGNQFFAADAFHWLVGEEKFSAPTALADEDLPIKHTRKEDTVWFLATIFLAPAMVLAGGLGFVSRSRRGRRA